MHIQIMMLHRFERSVVASVMYVLSVVYSRYSSMDSQDGQSSHKYVQCTTACLNIVRTYALMIILF